MQLTSVSEFRGVAQVAKELDSSPGQRTFSKSTGILEKDWKGIYWARWGDALSAAGLSPNSIQERYSTDFLLENYCEATRHFAKAPTRPEMRIYSKSNPGFPNYTTFQSHFGSINNLRAEAREWAEANEAFVDVVSLIPLAERAPSPSEGTDGIDGWVYLLQSGTHYKIGRGQDLERRIKQISVSLPEKVELVHAIKTDDPPGIENYWHRRFAERRANGEWFKLNRSDIKAFKRRKFQ